MMPSRYSGNVKASDSAVEEYLSTLSSRTALIAAKYFIVRAGRDVLSQVCLLHGPISTIRAGSAPEVFANIAALGG